MQCKLSVFEYCVYLSGWMTACFYGIYNLLQAQFEILEQDPNLLYFTRDLNPGWRFISRLKDESDVEWSSWKFFIQTSWFYMLLQFVISEIIRWRSIPLLKYWYIISTILFVTLYMGVKQLIIIFAQPVIFAGVLFLGGRKICIWVTSILLLASYNTLKNKYFFWRFLDSENLQDEHVFLILFAIAWVELRCISFCLDYVEKEQGLKKSKHRIRNQVWQLQNLVNLFSYVLYLPLLYVGPIILYEEYERSFTEKQEGLSLRLKRFIWDMLLFLIYTILLDFSFHYIYFYAMQSNIEAIKKLPTLALCGGGLWMGLEFHVKYVISYGTTAAYSRLDNIDAPPTPRCIARIHVYSQMWRYFDVGLYKFLFKYVYRPFNGALLEHFKLSKMISKLISSMGTFVFIFIWHGTMWNIFVWSVLNFIGVLIEYASRSIGNTEKYKKFKEMVLKTDAMEVRFIAFISAPLLAMSAISNFYLFAGSEVGNLYFGLLKWPTFYNCAIVYLSLYCSCQLGIALQDVPSRTDVIRNIEKKDK